MNRTASQSQSNDGNPIKESADNQNQSQSIKTPVIDTNHADSTALKDTLTQTEKKAQSFDELKISEGQYRPVAQAVGSWLDNINMDSLNYLNEQAENIFYRKGVTFTVYSDAKNIERMIPFDIIPRIIAESEWRQIEAGCKQRIAALNAFLHDIYHDQAITKADIVPASYVYASGCYKPWMMGEDRPYWYIWNKRKIGRYYETSNQPSNQLLLR